MEKEWGRGGLGVRGEGGEGEEGIIIELFTRLPYTRRPFMYTLIAPNIHLSPLIVYTAYPHRSDLCLVYPNCRAFDVSSSVVS